MQNFWSIIWIVVWSFLFVAYLIIFFRIITDLFSDHEVSGWVKAIWIVALIFVPFLTALIYLIARGNGMTKRGLAQAAEQRKLQDEYIRQTAGTAAPASGVDDIAKAKSLLDSGAITQAEFDAIKAKALA